MTFPVYQPDRPAKKVQARTLRRAMTEPEKRLWLALRYRLPKYRFRRQFVIGRFIADFCCLDARLVVEVDGNQHGADERQKRDASRTMLIENQRFRVIRFFNEDVMTSMDVVLDTIFAALSEPPPETEPEGRSTSLAPSCKGK